MKRVPRLGPKVEGGGFGGAQEFFNERIKSGDSGFVFGDFCIRLVGLTSLTCQCFTNVAWFQTFLVSLGKSSYQKPSKAFLEGSSGII